MSGLHKGFDVMLKAVGLSQAIELFDETPLHAESQYSPINATTDVTKWMPGANEQRQLHVDRMSRTPQIPNMGQITCVRFVPSQHQHDVRQLLICSRNGTAILFNAVTGNMRQKYTNDNGAITCAAFSPDSIHLLLGGTKMMKVVMVPPSDGQRHSREIKYGRTVKLDLSPAEDNLFQQDAGSVDVATWSLNRMLFFVANQQRGILYDGFDGRILGKLALDTHPNGQLLAAEFSPDSARLVLALERKCVVYEVGKHLHHSGSTLLDHEPFVLVDTEDSALPRQLRYSPQADFVLGARDNWVTMHQPWSRELLNKIELENGVTCIAVNRRSDFFAVGDVTGETRLYDTDGLELRALFASSSAVTSLDFSPDSSHLAIGTESGEIEFKDVGCGATGCVVRQAGQINAACFSTDGSKVLFAGVKGQAILYNSINGKELHKPRWSNLTRSCAFSPDGKSFVLGGDDKKAVVYDVETGGAIFTIQRAWTVATVSYSPDSTMLVVGGQDGMAVICDASTGEQKFVIDRKSLVQTATFSPDGSCLCVAGNDCRVVVYQTDTMDELHALTRPERVFSVAYSKDGKYLAAGGADRKVFIHEPRGAYKLLHKLSAEGQVTSCTFSPDSRRFVVGDNCGLISVLDAHTFAELFHIKRTKAIRDIAFAPNSDWLAFGGDDETGMVISGLTRDSPPLSVVDCDKPVRGPCQLYMAMPSQVSENDNEQGSVRSLFEKYAEDRQISKAVALLQQPIAANFIDEASVMMALGVRNPQLLLAILTAASTARSIRARFSVTNTIPLVIDGGFASVLSELFDELDLESLYTMQASQENGQDPLDEQVGPVITHRFEETSNSWLPLRDEKNGALVVARRVPLPYLARRSTLVALLKTKDKALWESRALTAAVTSAWSAFFVTHVIVVGMHFVQCVLFMVFTINITDDPQLTVWTAFNSCMLMASSLFFLHREYRQYYGVFLRYEAEYTDDREEEQKRKEERVARNKQLRGSIAAVPDFSGTQGERTSTLVGHVTKGLTKGLTDLNQGLNQGLNQVGDGLNKGLNGLNQGLNQGLSGVNQGLNQGLSGVNHGLSGIGDGLGSLGSLSGLAGGKTEFFTQDVDQIGSWDDGTTDDEKDPRQQTLSMRVFRVLKAEIDIWNLLDLTSQMVIIICSVLHFVSDFRNKGPHRDTHLFFCAVAPLMLLGRTLSFFRGFAALGWIVSVLLQNARDMVSFLIIVATFIYFTALSYMALFGDVDPAFYEDADDDWVAQVVSFDTALLQVFNMGIFGDFAVGGFGESGNVTFAYVLFVAFMVAVMLVGLNALIALLGDSFEQVQDRILAELNILRADLIVDYLDVMTPAKAAELEDRMVWCHMLTPRGDLEGGDDGEWSGRMKAIDKLMKKGQGAIVNNVQDVKSSVIKTMQTNQSQFRNTLESLNARVGEQAEVAMATVQDSNNQALANLRAELTEVKQAQYDLGASVHQTLQVAKTELQTDITAMVAQLLEKLPAPAPPATPRKSKKGEKKAGGGGGDKKGAAEPAKKKDGK